MTKLRVFVDADVLFAASASGSEFGASLVVLRLGEITLIDLITSEQVITEVNRNLQNKIPQALPIFKTLAERCLTVVPNPNQSQLSTYAGQADPKDLPILVSAINAEARWLLTFNTRHYFPTEPAIQIAKPGQFITATRHLLTKLI